MKKSKKYADKIVEVACHKLIPDKETVSKIVDALITEYADQETKELKDEIERLKAENEWISVEDRLPEWESNHYLVFTTRNEIHNGHWIAGIWLKNDQCQYTEVTHWQPLPKQPTKK